MRILARQLQSYLIDRRFFFCITYFNPQPLILHVIADVSESHLRWATLEELSLFVEARPQVHGQHELVVCETDDEIPHVRVMPHGLSESDVVEAALETQWTWGTWFLTLSVKNQRNPYPQCSFGANPDAFTNSTAS